MGLLDQLVSQCLGASGAGSPLNNVLANLVGGTGQGGAVEGAAAGGGLSALLARFENAGLGHLVQSWVGSGDNQPVTPEQLHSALGEEHVQTMAAQSGLTPHELLQQLSQCLPQLIDRMTPNGHPSAAPDRPV
jgi:uncharacterized protein YidB (DUF937 family)